MAFVGAVLGQLEITWRIYARNFLRKTVYPAQIVVSKASAAGMISASARRWFVMKTMIVEMERMKLNGKRAA